VVADPRVSTTIPATSRPERITENALAGNLKPMPQDLRDYVREETVRLL
jgi:aryl-alcohol dehydrogenase-like predicted oxidoreductase